MIDQSTDHTTENHPSYESLNNANYQIFAFPWSMGSNFGWDFHYNACLLQLPKEGTGVHGSGSQVPAGHRSGSDAALLAVSSWNSSEVRGSSRDSFAAICKVVYGCVPLCICSAVKQGLEYFKERLRRIQLFAAIIRSAVRGEAYVPQR